jgi:cytoskeletal protein CcmA (bactofilin family)
VVEDPTINMSSSKGRRTLDAVNGFNTSVGPDNIFKGSITGTGHSIILGKVEGDSDVEGTLVVGDGGVWTGNIFAENVVIAGKVEGNIVAKEKIDVVSTANIKGSLTSPFIAIAEGAIHEGEIHMANVKRYVNQREAE